MRETSLGMAEVPQSPARFLSEYLPARVAKLTTALGNDLSSAGCVTFRLSDRPQEYSLRLKGGRLICAAGMADDVVLQVTLTENDFKVLLVGAAERSATTTPSGGERAGIALRALGFDAERASLLRELVGTLAIEVRDDTETYRLFLTPGSAKPELAQPSCRISLSHADWLQMEAGRVLPLELLMGGKIRIEGNAQALLAFTAAWA